MGFATNTTPDCNVDLMQAELYENAQVAVMCATSAIYFIEGVMLILWHVVAFRDILEKSTGPPFQ